MLRLELLFNVTGVNTIISSIPMDTDALVNVSQLYISVMSGMLGGKKSLSIALKGTKIVITSPCVLKRVDGSNI